MPPVLLLLLGQLASFLLPKLLDWLRSLFTQATEQAKSTNVNKVFAEARKLSRGHPVMQTILRALQPIALKLERGEAVSDLDFAEVASHGEKFV